MKWMKDEKNRCEESWKNKSDVIVWTKNLKKKRDEKMKKWCDLTSEEDEVEDDEEEEEFEKETHIRNYSFNWYSC